MKKTKLNTWSKWEVGIEIVTVLTTAPCIIGAHVRFIYSDNWITVLARSKSEAEKKALSLVKGFEKESLVPKKLNLNEFF